jgi:uncharacterized protein
MEVYLLLAGVVFLAAFTQGVTGFGSGLVAMALIPLFMDLRDAVPIVALLGIAVNGAIMWQLRHHIDRKKVLPMVLGALLGVPFGVYALKTLDAGLLKLALGLILVGYVGYALLGGDERRVRVGDWWGLLAGGLGGVLGGAFNTSGPPVILYVTLKDWDKHAIKASLQVFFVAISLTAVPLHIVSGNIKTEHLPLAGVALPILLLGVWVGTRVYDRIDGNAFRKVVLLGLAVMGLFYVVQNRSVFL